MIWERIALVLIGWIVGIGMTLVFGLFFAAKQKKNIFAKEVPNPKGRG